MQGQEAGTNLFCIYRDCEDLALFGDYCRKHQFQRAEAAEARAAARSELIDIILSTWEAMTERLLYSEARAAQLETDNDEMQSYINEIRVTLHTEKDELTIEAVRRVILERDELARKLEQAQHALSLADVGNFDALCDWISGAQSELHQARLTIDNLTSPRDDFPYEGDEMEALQREATA